MRRTSFAVSFLLSAAALIASGAPTRAGEIVFERAAPRNLYIFTVGIDDYSQTVLAAGNLPSLRLAKADAVALADEFDKRGQGLFGKIKKVTLLDAQARRDDGQPQR
jgi:hypothetical protein